MNITKLSALTARKRQLNQLCTAAVEQQVEQNRAENNHLRKRRRYLAKQLLKRVPLQQRRSDSHWLHAVTLVFALWGFNDLVMSNQAVAAPSFGSENPFAGLGVGDGNASSPVFADIDGDGDLDAFVGNPAFNIEYFRNTEIDADVPGTGFVKDDAANPLAVVDRAYAPKLAFADIDGDGDLDAFVGQYYNDIKYYRNTEIDADVPGTGFVKDAAGNPLALVPYVYAGSSSLTFADIDGDGDLDAFVGNLYADISYYRNTEIDGGSTAEGTGFVADTAGNPLAAANVAFPMPTFADLDADGDLDAFVGVSDGTVKYYRNTEIDAGANVGFVADAAGSPLAGYDFGSMAAPSFADIDGDGDLDGFIGSRYGTLEYFRNTEIDALTPDIGLVHENPLVKVDVGWISGPRFADIDGDGDQDVFVGERYGTIKYYRNTEIDAGADEGFVADEAGNLLAAFNVGGLARPDFVDLDGDGDLDAFVGAQDGTIKYYRNTKIDADVPGTGFVADTAGNPFDALDVGGPAAPAFADIDGDGDLDAFIGENDSRTVKYYRNTEIDAGADVGFVADATGNPLAAVYLSSSVVPRFADLDGDGDLDAFIGEWAGNINYYRNTEIDETAPGTGFVADVAGNPLADFNVLSFANPSFVDIEGDGDLDAFLGRGNGRITYFKNSDPVPVTVDDSLDAIAGVTTTTVDVSANDEFKLEAPADLFTLSAFDATTANGATVANNGGNTFDYTALAGFSGSDSFTYTLDDGAGNTAVATVLVTVTPAIPSVDIQGEPTLVNSLSAFPITVEFSEDVTGFDALTDVTVVNGTVNSITPVDGNTYTVSISPDGNDDISIDIAASVATSISAGINNAAAIQAVVNFDGSTPIVTINANPVADANNENIYVVSGDCSIGDGDVLLDISGSVGTASWLASCTMSGTWSASFDVSTVADEAMDAVIDASQTDSAGNTGVAATVTLTRNTAGGVDGVDDGGGALNPWSLLLLPLVSWLRRKIS